MFYAANGRITKAREKKLFVKQNISFEQLTENENLDNAYFGLLCFTNIYNLKIANQRLEADVYAKIYAMTVLYKPKLLNEYFDAANRNFKVFNENWKAFIEHHKINVTIEKIRLNKKTNQETKQIYLDYRKWFNSPEFRNDVIDFYSSISKV